MKVIDNNENLFVKRFSLEKLSYYRAPETLAIFFRIANDPAHPLKDVALTSILSQFKTKYKTKAFSIISSLPENDFLHYKALKSLAPFIDEIGLNGEIINYLFDQFKTGNNAKVFMTLDVFKYHHNSEIFDFLVKEFATHNSPDEKNYLEDTLQFILNTNPYYITPSYSNKNIHAIVEGLNFQQIDYRLLIHLCRLSISDDILFKITMNHCTYIGSRLENILLDKSLTFEEKRLITVYLVKSSVDLTPRTIDSIKEQFYSFYPREIKDAFLSLLIKDKNSINFDFINFNVYLSSNDHLRNEFYHYAGTLL
jgi:hypothetical protein